MTFNDALVMLIKDSFKRKDIDNFHLPPDKYSIEYKEESEG